MIHTPWCFLIVELSDLGSDEGYSQVVLLHRSMYLDRDPYSAAKDGGRLEYRRIPWMRCAFPKARQGSVSSCDVT